MLMLEHCWMSSVGSIPGIIIGLAFHTEVECGPNEWLVTLAMVLLLVLLFPWAKYSTIFCKVTTMDRTSFPLPFSTSTSVCMESLPMQYPDRGRLAVITMGADSQHRQPIVFSIRRAIGCCKLGLLGSTWSTTLTLAVALTSGLKKPDFRCAPPRCI